MARHKLDRLPRGAVLPEGWGGAVGPDDNVQALYAFGPQPPPNPLARLVVTSTAQGEPLPPHLAALCLTAEAIRTQRLRQMLFRACIDPKTASKAAALIRRTRQRRRA